MNNKKLTKVIKKATVVAIMGITAAVPLIATTQRASAATYTASEYFPGADEMDNRYDDFPNSYFRNFKNRSANLYVKDKKVKKVFQKAAKAWSPVFKFKFVNSGKHANFNSSKYANVVVKKDGGMQSDYATANKEIFFAGSTKTLKQMHKDFPYTRTRSWYGVYANGKITNYKVWKANNKKAIANRNDYIMPEHRTAKKVGMWIPSESAAKKNSWNHYITVLAGTNKLTQAQQIGNATEILGRIIGLGEGANPIHEKDETFNENESSSYYTYKVTQSDLDHVNWIYAHPWSGSNYFWDNATIEG